MSEGTNLKDLLQKSPLDMSDDELKENIQKIQNIRRMPDLHAAVTGKKKTKATKTAEPSLEDALLAMSKKKEAEVDTGNTTTG